MEARGSAATSPRARGRQPRENKVLLAWWGSGPRARNVAPDEGLSGPQRAADEAPGRQAGVPGPP